MDVFDVHLIPTDSPDEVHETKLWIKRQEPVVNTAGEVIP